MNAPVHHSRWQQRATCKSCGYALRNLPKPVCPECGNGFDPNDPNTMHVSAWVNWLDRTLLGSPGWISHTLCALPLLLAIAASADLMRNGDIVIWSFLGVLIMAPYWIVRLITWLSLRSFYGHEHARQRHWLHWLVTPACGFTTITLWLLEF